VHAHHAQQLAVEQLLLAADHGDRTPSISRQALGPSFTDTPVIIGPFSVHRPSLSAAP
jgi:hypothetical protein